MKRKHLQNLSREELIREAEGAGVPRPRVLTQAELVDELLKRTATSDRERSRSRGWLGRARDLLATVVEKGLHLPDAAAAIRSGSKGWPPAPPPIATVTLAEIYAAQGHLERAVAVLSDVLVREPEHQEAKELRDRFLAQLARSEAAASGAPAPTSKSGADMDHGAVGDSEASAESSAGASKQASDEGDSDASTSVAEGERAAASDDASEVSGAKTAGDAAPVEGESVKPSVVEKVLEDAPAARLMETADEKKHSASAEKADVLGREAAPDEASSAALPQRYDVDEVVALAVDPSTFYVYWEVRPVTFAHVLALGPQGSLALRVVAITPGWDGPIVETRDIAIDALFGDRFVHHVRPRADVRVSVGWLDGDKFDPIAVGTEVSAPRAFVAAGGPSAQGAPMDLSEGLHGFRGGSDRAVELYARRQEGTTNAAGPRGSERVSGGFVPRDLPGQTIELSLEHAGTGWIWVPSSALVLARSSDGTVSLSSDDGGRWVRAEEVAPRWGGASEVAPRWGGAS